MKLTLALDPSPYEMFQVEPLMTFAVLEDLGS